VKLYKILDKSTLKWSSEWGTWGNTSKRRKRQKWKLEDS